MGGGLGFSFACAVGLDFAGLEASSSSRFVYCDQWVASFWFFLNGCEYTFLMHF
jgi:hypothetical protein